MKYVENLLLGKEKQQVRDSTAFRTLQKHNHSHDYEFLEKMILHIK